MIECFSPPDWHICRRAIFKSLICFGFAALFSTEAKTQTIPAPSPTPPIDIPAHTATGGVTKTFFAVPSSPTASFSVDISEPNATAVSHLKVIAYPAAPFAGLPPPDKPLLTIWDHERLRGANNQLLTALHLVADLPFAGDFPDDPNNPSTCTYTIEVIDDTPGPIGSSTVGTLTACSLTLNPNNPGHVGAPTVNLYGGTQNEAVPGQINFGHPLTLVTKAVGRPASYKIARLGIKITEKLNANPLLNHNSGLGPGSYVPANIMQSVASSSGITFPYTPPILPPGTYQIDATAWDSAGFPQTVSKNLAVNRLFGFFGVSNIVRTVNTTCDETQPPFLPCNTTNFSATLNLENHTPTASGPLRIRLVAVPGSAFEQDVSPPQLPAPVELTSASIGPVTPLAANGVEHVQISGIIPAPIQNNDKSGIGFQVFALLDTSSGLGVDAIKVTEGEWARVHGFGGVGGGVIAPRPGIGGSAFDPKPRLFKNISTRCRVLTGDKVLIAGFVVTGNVPKKVIIRAIGPSLTLAGKLLNPTLELHNGAGALIRSNDNWGSAANHQEIANCPVPPTNASESAILISLQPGAYTAIARGVGGTTGIALVEVFDLDPIADSQLVNISSRGFVSTGNDVMIGGTIVGATGKVLARAIGPSLQVAGVPIAGRLQDPTLELHNINGALIAFNDNWKTSQAAAIQATGAPPKNDHESAILTTVPPGNYTVIVRGKNNTTGVALVECYNVQ